ncbi:MAG: hypothetical protein R3Y64_06555 [Peptostreptococcaceae bacterium]
MLKYIKYKEKVIATLLASGLIINNMPISAFASEVGILNGFFKSQTIEKIENDIMPISSQTINDLISRHYNKDINGLDAKLTTIGEDEFIKLLMSSLESSINYKSDEVKSAFAEAKLSYGNEPYRVLTESMWLVYIESIQLTQQFLGYFTDEDRNILSALREVTSIKKLTISGLDLTTAGFSDLYNNIISYFTNLEELDASNNDIEDISSLRNLETNNKFKLDLSSNKISNISPLGGKEFSSLNLANNNISDVSSFKDGVNRSIAYMNLDNNSINNVSYLGSSVQELVATGQKIDGGELQLKRQENTITVSSVDYDSYAFSRGIVTDKYGYTNLYTLNVSNMTNNGLASYDGVAWLPEDIKNLTTDSTISYDFKFGDNDGGKYQNYSGTISHTIFGNRAPQITNRYDDLTIVTGSPNTINYDKIVYKQHSETKNGTSIMHGIEATDLDEDDSNVTEYVTVMLYDDKGKVLDPITANQSDPNNMYLETKEEIEWYLFMHLDKVTNNHYIEYTITDGFGLSATARRNIVIEKNIDPVITTTSGTVSPVHKYTEDGRQFSLADKIAEFDSKNLPVIEIGPKELAEFYKNDWAFINDENYDFITITDENEDYPFKLGTIEVDTLQYIKDGSLAIIPTKVAKPNTPPQAKTEGAIDMYKITYKITDSNGGKNEVEFWLVVTNYAPEVIMGSKISQHITHPLTYTELSEGMIVKDFEDIGVDENGNLMVLELYKDSDLEKYLNLGMKIEWPSNIGSIVISAFSGTYDSLFRDTTSYTRPNINISLLDERPGSYKLTYKITDSDGNESSTNQRDLEIFHPSTPLLTINDPSVILLRPGLVKDSLNMESIIERLIITDDIDSYEDLIKTVVVEYRQFGTTEWVKEPQIPGLNNQIAYEIRVSVTDSDGNTGYSPSLNATITNDAPVIRFNDPEITESQTITINEGDKVDLRDYIDPFDTEANRENFDLNNDDSLQIFAQGGTPETSPSTIDGNITGRGFISTFLNNVLNIKTPQDHTSKLVAGDYIFTIYLVDQDGNSVTRDVNVVVKGPGEVDANLDLSGEKVENGKLILTIQQAINDYGVYSDFEKLLAKLPIGQSLRSIVMTYNGARIDGLKDHITNNPLKADEQREYKVIYSIEKDGMLYKTIELVVVVTNMAPQIQAEDITVPFGITIPEGMFKTPVKVTDYEDGEISEFRYEIFNRDDESMNTLDTAELSVGRYNLKYFATDSDDNTTVVSVYLDIDGSLPDEDDDLVDPDDSNDSTNPDVDDNDSTNPDVDDNDSTNPDVDDNDSTNPDIGLDGSNNDEDSSDNNSNGGGSSGDHGNSIFKMYDLTGDRSLNLRQAVMFKQNPLIDVEIVNNDLGVTLEDIEVMGLENFTPERDLFGDQRVKDYMVTYKVRGYNVVNNSNIAALLVANTSFMNGVMLANDQLVLTVERKITVTNENPELMGPLMGVVASGEIIDALTGMQARDVEDGDLTSRIIVSPDPEIVDTSNVGDTITLTYSVEDNDGNIDTLIRDIEVVDDNTQGTGDEDNLNQDLDEDDLLDGAEENDFENPDDDSSDSNGGFSGNNSSGTTTGGTSGYLGLNPDTGDASIIGISALAIASGVGLLVVNRKKKD